MCLLWVSVFSVLSDVREQSKVMREPGRTWKTFQVKLIEVVEHGIK